MAYNGSGVFIPLVAPTYPAVDGTTIVASYYNAVIADLISGLNLALPRDGQGAATANLPMGGFKLTGLGAGSAAGNSVEYAQFLAALANLVSSTSATLPAATTIGTVSAAEILRLSGVTSPLQGQLDAKAALASPVFTGAPAGPTATTGTSTTQLATTAFVGATAFNAALPSQAGNSGKFVTTNGTTASWAGIGVPRIARTSNTIIAAANTGAYFDASGTFTQTFDTPANLGTTWYCYYANNGTGDITIPASDGVTNWVMYPGAVRIFQSDGTTLRSLPICGGVKTFSSSGSHVMAPGILTVMGQLLGAGASGGAGGRSTSASGGGGGAGGEYVERLVKGIAAGTTTSVTIGAGGASVAGRTTDGSTTLTGTAGGNTSFGTSASALGGGGSGGSSEFPGAGTPFIAGTTVYTWLSGNLVFSTGGGAGAVGTDSGGGSGCVNGITANAGRRSLRGGGGGGGGGGWDATLYYVGGTGGASGRLAGTLSTNTGFGGTAGAISGAGAAGGQATDSLAGHGGGGGGGNVGAGGAGGLGAGGGGGGASTIGVVSGAGGAGGNGICVVTEIL